MAKEFKQTILQLIKFAIVGVSNTVISEGIYVILIYFRVHYIPASFFGFAISVLNAYYWNNKYVFKASEDGKARAWWKVLIKTYFSYGWGYLVNVGLLALWMDIVRIERFFTTIAAYFGTLGYDRVDARFLAGACATIINLIMTVPMNFIINKYWAYRQKTQDE